MAKKEKPKKNKNGKKKPGKSTDKTKDKDFGPSSLPAEQAPPVRAHHNYEVSRPPFPVKLTAERTKNVEEQHEQQQQQGKKESKSGSGGSSGGSGSGGGGGDAVKGMLEAIVAFGDDTGFVALDPRLADLLARAKQVLSQQEE